MRSFTFTDPATGREFTVQAPDGTSLSQARAVFEQQLGTGKLAGISIGATLDSATQSLGKLKDIPVVNAVDVAELARQVPAQIPIGTMNLNQVSASLAQTAKDVAQAATAISAEKGVGQYGISPQQLEAAGFIKPGTVSGYLKDPNQIQAVLGNPSVWTGKKNVNGLDQLLGDVKLQSLTQNEVMLGALDGLKQAGALSGKEAPEQLASLVQLGSKFGVGNAVSWVQGQAPADVINEMNAAAKNAQFSVNLSDKLAESEQALKKSAEGFKATVNRAKVNKAFADVLGDPKIPIPSFSPEPSDQTDDQSILDQLSAAASVAGTQATEMAGSVFSTFGRGALPRNPPRLSNALGSASAFDRNIIGELGGGPVVPGVTDSGTGIFEDFNSSPVRQEVQAVIGTVQRAGTRVFRSLAEQVPTGIDSVTAAPVQPISDLTSRFPASPPRRRT